MVRLVRSAVQMWYLPPFVLCQFCGKIWQSVAGDVAGKVWLALKKPQAPQVEHSCVAPGRGTRCIRLTLAELLGQPTDGFRFTRHVFLHRVTADDKAQQLALTGWPY